MFKRVCRRKVCFVSSSSFETRMKNLLLLLVFLTSRGISFGAPETPPPPAKPITADKGPIGELLRKWAAEGTAAGNVDDWYDNRDRGHSRLDVSPYPQLQVIEYSEGDRKTNRDWALQTAVRPGTVFGNSSTSAGPTTGGSNPRMAYAARGGIAFLYGAYRKNNLYLYPAHHDHHPGHNGMPLAAGSFYGDLFPTNTPYFIISQGSSGTDQPFMKAVAFTLAAFRPEVKSKLVAEGMLMPAIQMIFRMCTKQVSAPADYLTGKAHPPVFRGDQVDALKMVRMAHDIELKTLPPLATIRIVEEDSAESGRDYFEPVLTEALADSPCAIARVYRAMAPARRVILSAADSIDINRLPLTYHWVVLRGDPARVKIQPRDKAGSSAEIIIPYHDRAPIAPGEAMESNRVDIGVFVHNGTHYSPPAFFTSLTLDNEARTYDGEGRLIEVGYSMGESLIDVSNWPALFAALRTEPLSPGVRILTGGWKPAEFAAVAALGESHKAAAAKVDSLANDRKEADAAVQKAAPEAKKDLEAAAKKAREAVDAATKLRDALIAEKQPGLDQPLKSLVESRLRALLADPGFYSKHGATLDSKSGGVAAALKRLLAYGIASQAGEGPLELNAVLPGNKPAAERLSRYQKAMLAQFNGAILAASIPGMRHDFRANLVDFRLSSPKVWRDVYHYSADGKPTGWTRYDGTAATDFNARGHLVETRDAQGRCLTARSVIYDRKRPAGYDPRSGPDRSPLTFSPGFHEFRYEYESERDQVGKMIESAASK